MHRQFAIDAQYCIRKAQVVEKARGWGILTSEPTATSTISAGTCARWSSHDVPHWMCQTLQSANCKEYPIPKEEAREDATTEDISSHVYKYKVSMRKDGKERRWLEPVQKASQEVTTRLMTAPPVGTNAWSFSAASEMPRHPSWPNSSHLLWKLSSNLPTTLV